MKGWDGSALSRCVPTHGCADPDRSPKPRWDPLWSLALVDPAVILKERSVYSACGTVAGVFNPRH